MDPTKWTELSLAEERKNIRSTILAYLLILLEQTSIEFGEKLDLSHTEIQVGRSHICGCLIRLMEFAEFTEDEEMQAIIKEREEVNCRWIPDYNNPEYKKELSMVSEKCASYLHDYLRSGCQPKEQKKFLAELDSKFKEILRM